MSDTKQAMAALQALAEASDKRTKMGRFRELLPQIEATHRAGVPHQQILETLKLQGLDLTPKAYSVMLYRARQDKEKGGAQYQQAAPIAAPAAPAPGQPAPVSPVPVKAAETTPAPENLDGLTDKQRRELRADKFISSASSNPLFKRIAGKGQ